MATLTVVITYTGTLGSTDAEVQSYTSAGTAFGSLTGPELRQAKQAMSKAIKRTDASHAAKLRPGNTA